MKRRHDMLFGARLQDDGSVRFRLWAPAPKAVELLIERDGGAVALPMTHAEPGWFELVTREAGAGTRYRYRIDGGAAVPDPASRSNPLDVHGPSEVVDPHAFEWSDESWRGRPWEAAVIYELHVGTFTPDGTFPAAIDRLDHLVELGVTAIELMPLADFAGSRGWGYDGVLPFAPDASYGTPDDLKGLVDAAHAKGLMVLLDVVYNHFGPDGNYLGLYAPQFFTDRHQTPWGAAIDFDGEHGRWVRRFVVDNALYWLQEFHFDGLRLDAVHAIMSDTSPSVLEEIACAVREGPGRDRAVHLVLENDDNAARHLARDPAGQPRLYTAQWDDDIHHAFHVIATGETDGYYADYAGDPCAMLGRCLTEGFAFQGDPSPFRQGERRGEPSAHLPATAFVAFTQNHDQVGNRAFGERIGALAPAPALEAVTAIHLLAPLPPLLFMGEEFAAATPFLYFCDFDGDLARAVREGRRGEFARFEKFSDPAVAATIPDPNAPETFEASRLDWSSLSRPAHARALARYRELLAIRHRDIVPRLGGMRGGGHAFTVRNRHGLTVRWQLGDGAALLLQANLGDRPVEFEREPAGRVLHATPDAAGRGAFAPWAVRWTLIEH